MVGLTSLLVPIVLSAVIVFFASFAIHMTPWHKSDYPKLPNEDAVRNAIRPLNLPPGDYFIPKPESMAELKSAAHAAKLKEGPIVVMTVFPNGDMGMGRSLGLWFVYCLVVAVFAGYVSGRALPHGADYLHVFRFAGVTAFAGFSLALLQMSIWYRRAWLTTIKSMLDGLLYALLVAGTFGWRWPHA